MEQKVNIFKNAPFGYAFHRIILDEVGKPVDYEFMEANKAFDAGRKGLRHYHLPF